MHNTYQKYDCYKDSGVEWLGEIPEEWEVKKLKYILKIKNGQDYKNVISDFGYPVMGSGGQFAYANDFMHDGEVLLLGRKGTIDKPQYFNGKFWTVDTMFYAIAKEGYLTKFLYYTSLTIPFKLYGTSTALPSMTQDDLNNNPVFIPPFKEQTAISNFLDDKTTKIDQAIAQKEQLIALLKERKQIIIQDLVTGKKVWNKELNAWTAPTKTKDSGVEWIGEIPVHWEVKRLKYVLKERNERSVTGDEPLLMMSQVHGLVVRSEYHEKAELAASNVGNKLVRKGDLVFNKLKAHLGVFFKSEIDFEGLVSPDYAVYYSNGKLQDLKYLELLFRHPDYIGQFIIRATGIVEGLIRLYTGDLFEIPIAIPEREEQSKILARVEIQSAKIDRAIALQKAQIEKLKEYKATLIDSAVTGKLRVPSVQEIKVS